MNLGIINNAPQFLRNMPAREYQRLAKNPHGCACDKCGNWSSYWDAADTTWNKVPPGWRDRHLCRSCFKGLVTEGVAAAARADAMNICNEVASNVAQAAVTIFGDDEQLAKALSFTKPRIDQANAENEPAVVTLRLGSRTPEMIAVTIYGDGGGEINLEMSERLSRLLMIPSRALLSSLDEVIEKFGDIAATIKDKLESSNVKNRNRKKA